MVYHLTNEFTKINESSGTIQNSSSCTLELSTKDENDSGISLLPRQMYVFRNATIYLRCMGNAATVRVVPFAFVAASGSADSGGDESISFDDVASLFGGGE